MLEFNDQTLHQIHAGSADYQPVVEYVMVHHLLLW
ncbi:3-deoxy-manno-octulosonate cytidylyltransferase [Moritella sp. PE36]|nr:3-deoxy-manno-octulosonate cytidylyltransferase [Moritella sp. PE36]